MAVLRQEMLRCGPLRRGRDPRYPTRRAVALRPALLAAHQPPRWQAHRDLAALAGALLAAGATGCERTPGGGAGVAPTPTLVVAPVFDHGRGRVAIGCVAIMPPAFLTEAEALAVIRTEFAAVGVALDEVDVPLDGVEITGSELKYGFACVEGNALSTLVEITQPLVVDAYDRQHGIAVEFVSEQDFVPLGGAVNCFGTAGTEDYVALARKLRSEIARQARPPLRVGVFYEPAIYEHELPARSTPSAAGAATTAPASEPARPPTYEEWREAYRATTLAAEQDALRAQVRDFIDWLRAQGAL